MTSLLTGKNQTTVPADVARRSGMRRGTRLEWTLTEQPGVLQVRVLPDIETVAAEARGSGRAHRRHGGSAVGRLVEERERDDSGHGGR
jgi:bifunctional DNA-binding transcriptional regulator/antitoxin component of YhaV-PrlF toxin-antitoxin module